MGDFAAKKFTMGQLNSLVKKLGGAHVTQLVLQEKLIVSFTQNWPIWKTLRFGNRKTSTTYMEAFKSSRLQLNAGDEVVNQITFSKEEVEVDLVILSVEDLGFDYAAYEDICAKAGEIGLELCTAEVALALRLQYRDQPPNEKLHVGMEGILDQNENPTYFSLSHASKLLCVDGENVYSDAALDDHERLIFVRPRKNAEAKSKAA